MESKQSAMIIKLQINTLFLVVLLAIAHTPKEIYNIV